jgi:hypothetical protein
LGKNNSDHERDNQSINKHPKFSRKKYCVPRKITMTLCENKTDQNTKMVPIYLNNIYCKMLLNGQNISDQVISRKYMKNLRFTCQHKKCTYLNIHTEHNDIKSNNLQNKNIYKVI